MSPVKSSIAAVLASAVHAFGIIVTNGPSFNTNAPSNPLVGWQYTASRMPMPDGRGMWPTIIGPRLAVTVQHINFGSAVYFRDVAYVTVMHLKIPNTDIEFLGLDKFVPEYAKVFQPPVTDPIVETVVGDGGWLISAGGSYSTTDGRIYNWGPVEFEGIGVKRWVHSGEVRIKNPFGEAHFPGRRVAIFRWDEGGICQGDSGGAAFLSTGEFLCNITWGQAPTTIGRRAAVGELVWPYMRLFELQPYLTNAVPQAPPKPVTIRSLKVSRKAL